MVPRRQIRGKKSTSLRKVGIFYDGSFVCPAFPLIEKPSNWPTQLNTTSFFRVQPQCPNMNFKNCVWKTICISTTGPSSLHLWQPVLSLNVLMLLRIPIRWCRRQHERLPWFDLRDIMRRGTIEVIDMTRRGFVISIMLPLLPSMQLHLAVCHVCSSWIGIYITEMAFKIQRTMTRTFFISPFIEEFTRSLDISMRLAKAMQLGQIAILCGMIRWEMKTMRRRSIAWSFRPLWPLNLISYLSAVDLTRRKATSLVIVVLRQQCIMP
mmetsp:Transcript_28185/g.60043  ORF Transcript_28185/g.60043 Transcript_28185/m.60043 type:complete len:266 (-) Transcript_28185:391-1188(-)